MSKQKRQNFIDDVNLLIREEAKKYDRGPKINIDATLYLRKFIILIEAIDRYYATVAQKHGEGKLIKDRVYKNQRTLVRHLMPWGEEQFVALSYAQEIEKCREHLPMYKNIDIFKRTLETILALSQSGPQGDFPPPKTNEELINYSIVFTLFYEKLPMWSDAISQEMMSIIDYKLMIFLKSLSHVTVLYRPDLVLSDGQKKGQSSKVRNDLIRKEKLIRDIKMAYIQEINLYPSRQMRENLKEDQMANAIRNRLTMGKDVKKPCITTIKNYMKILHNNNEIQTPPWREKNCTT